MLIDASSLTKSIIDKGLSKVDKINKLSDTVIDKGSETVENTSDSLNNIISNISSITDIFKSENFYYFLGILVLVIIIIKKIWINWIFILFRIKCLVINKFSNLK